MNRKRDIQILLKKFLSRDLSQRESEQLERYIEEFPEYIRHAHACKGMGQDIQCQRQFPVIHEGDLKK